MHDERWIKDRARWHKRWKHRSYSPEKPAGRGVDFVKRVCEELSLWWSHQEHIGLFRCKMLSEAGEIEAVNDVGKPLTDLIVIRALNMGPVDMMSDDFLDILLNDLIPYSGKKHWLLVARLGDHTEPQCMMAEEAFSRVVEGMDRMLLMRFQVPGGKPVIIQPLWLWKESVRPEMIDTLQKSTH